MAIAAEIYQQKLVPAEVGLAALYKAFDPQGYEKAKKHRDLMVDSGTGLKRYSKWQCHLTSARVTNRSVSNHKDGGDSRGTMATWTCFGKFTGADICLPTLDHRLSFLPGDAMILNAAICEHCVTPFNGKRTSIVWFSKSDKDSIVKHFTQMEGEELAAFRKQHAIDMGNREDVREDLRATEEARVQHYIDAGFEIASDEKFPSWNEWRLTGVPSRPNKLAKATVEKNKEIRAFKKVLPQADLGEVGFMRNLPDSLFYPFTRAEKIRLERERPPFEALKPTTKRDHTTGTSELDSK